MAITTNLDKVRLEIGDTDVTNFLFSDDEINYFLEVAGDNVLLAALRACEAAARQFARAYDFKTDGQEFKRSQQAQAFREMAKDLRARVGTSGTLPVTRVDGYSDDIESQDVLINNQNVRRRYYGQEDRIP